jgi:uncharacterized membrane protein SirB2
MTGMDYASLKIFHVAAVALSVTGFAVRALGALAGADWVRRRAARTLPHVLDSLLLLSGLALLWMLRLSPHQAPWLAAKLVGLVVYIALGVIALRPATAKGVRAVSAVLAVATVAWMVSVARSKNPMGALAMF